MKKLIIISGVTGTILLIFRLIGTITDFALNDVLLWCGLFLLLIVFFPLVLVERYKQNKKLDDIIDSYSCKKPQHERIPKGNSVTSGWGMNNSPFRDRKGSASWGGGNIKASNVSRSKRKSFLGSR